MKIKIIKTSPFPCTASIPTQYEFEATSRMGRLCSVFMTANSYGVDICMPFSLQVTWYGANEFKVETENKSIIEYIWTSHYQQLIGVSSNFWCSKIEGVFQLDPGLIYISPHNTKLLLMAPMNTPQDNIWIHTGILDSDWFAVPSTINIQFVKAGSKVFFKKGKPIARLMPLGGRTAIEPIMLNEQDISEYPEIIEYWRNYINQTHESTNLGLKRLKYGAYKELKERTENASM